MRLDHIPRRQFQRPHVRLRISLAVAALLTLTSCVSGGSTEPPTTSTMLATSEAPTTTSTISAPVPPAGELPAVLVAHEDGIDLWRADGSTPLLTGQPVVVAVPDLSGGVLYQGSQIEFGEAVPIEWIPVPGGPAVPLIDAPDALMLTLVQVADIDGAATAVYRKWVELPNDCAAEDAECRWDYHREYLVLRDLGSGSDRQLGAIGSFESDVVGFSFGHDRVAFAFNGYEGGGCAGWLPSSVLIDAADGDWIGEGSEIDAACRVGPTPECPAGERCDGVARAAVAPDGGLIAYAFSRWSPDTGRHHAPTLVIHDPAEGTDLITVEVGEAGVQPAWIDFNGEFVLLGRTDTRVAGEAIEPLLVDLSGASFPLPVTGRATLWSGPEPDASQGATHSLPIDDRWALGDLAWPVWPACCDIPALAPASPPGPIPDVGPWPDEDFTGLADGFYDVTVNRAWGPPGVVEMSIRHWVPCAQRPDECPDRFPENGVFADPSTEVHTHLVLAEGLTVVIQPLQRWENGRHPDPPQVLTGSGSAFYELLSGWCSGFLPERNPVNCGLDDALLDWVWYPSQGGASIDEIIADLEASGGGPDFPFSQFDDRSTDAACGTDRRCITAYRGPGGTHLIVDFTLLDMGEDWPDRLYGWWATLEIRDGRPVLYIDAGRLFG